MSENLPVILIELVLVFGGVLAFGWWQLRSVRRDREALATRRRAEPARHAADATPDSENSDTSSASGRPPIP